MCPANCLNEQTLAGLSGDIRSPPFAALGRRCRRVRAQPAFLLRCAVALVTVLRKDGLYLAEIIDRSCGATDQGCRNSSHECRKRNVSAETHRVRRIE